jgi:hypothetical protein
MVSMKHSSTNLVKEAGERTSLVYIAKLHGISQHLWTLRWGREMLSTYISRAKHPSTLCTKFDGDARELYGGMSFLMLRRCICVVHPFHGLGF